MGEIIQLYTSLQLDDPNPNAYPYYIDYSGDQAIQVAFQQLQQPYDPTYRGVIRKSTGEVAWVDPVMTLRLQGLQNGDMLTLIPDPALQQQQPQYEPEPEPEPVATPVFDYQEAQPVSYEVPSYQQADAKSDSDDEMGLVINSNVDFTAAPSYNMDDYDGVSEDDQNALAIKVYEDFTNNDLPPVKILPSQSHDSVMNTLMRHLGKTRDTNYSILVSYSDNDRRWFPKDGFVEGLGITSNMSLHLFQQVRQINVQSKHFSNKKIMVDISKPVDELRKTIAESLKVTAFLTFCIYSIENPKRPKPLDLNRSIPEQTIIFNDVMFLRRYFIFTSSDLETIEDARLAYRDARDMFAESNIHEFKTKHAIEYAALSICAENPNTEVDSIPDDLQYILPKFVRKTMIGSEVRKYFQSMEAPDEFNAIRRYLAFVRRFMGFATEYFEARVTYKSETSKNRLDVIVGVSPYRILLIHPDTDVREDRINLTKVVSVETMGNTVDIRFQAGFGQFAKYTFHGEEMSQMAALVLNYRDTIRRILSERAGGDLLEGNRVTLLSSLSMTDPNPRHFSYSLGSTGKNLVLSAEKQFGIEHDEDHAVLLELMEGQYRWVAPDAVLGQLNVMDGAKLFLLKSHPPVRITYADGSTKVIKIDITQPIEELTSYIFEKAGQPAIIGYTLYHNNTPLDTRFSIPEQTTDYSQLAFKRRFFILSGEVLQTPLSAHVTLCDCRQHIMDGYCQVPEDKALELALLNIYATQLQHPSDITKHTSFRLESMLPKEIKITSKLNKAFQALVQSYPQMEPFPAAKKYIRIARELPGFGMEKFRVNYQDLSTSNSPEIRGCTFCIGPKNISLFDPSGKPISQPIGYRFITTYQHIKRTLQINIERNGVRNCWQLKVKEIDTVVMLISYNIKIIRDLVVAKQRKRQKDQEEIARRLEGKWVDERGAHGPMLEFLVSKTLAKTQTLLAWVDLLYDCNLVVDTLRIPLKLEPSTEYAVLVRVAEGAYKWLSGDLKLQDLKPVRHSLIVCLPARPSIKFTSTSGRSQVAQVTIEDTVDGVVKEVSTLFDVKHSLGYTLWVPKEEGEPDPLDIQRSIPEQTPEYRELIFKRRFFVISTFDFEEPAGIALLYSDSRELVLSGRVDMTGEQAVELASLALSAGSEVEFPKGMKVKNSQKKQVIKKSILPDKAMKGYINYARQLATFGSWRFKGTLVQDKGKVKCIVFVAPGRVFATDEAGKRELADVNYKKFIRVDAVSDEVAIKFSREGKAAGFIRVETQDATEIETLIKSHQSIHNQLLMLRAAQLKEGEDPLKSTDRVDLVVGGQRLVLDNRYTGTVVISRAASLAGFSQNGQLSALLRLANDEARWLESNKLIGLYNPCDGMTLKVLSNYARMAVTRKYSASPLVDVTLPLHQLINTIGLRVFSEFPLGCTLYQAGKPLSLRQSVPEQVDSLEGLELRRRFYVVETEDVTDIRSGREIFEDMKERVLSGDWAIGERESLELAVYALLADGLPLPSDLTTILPKGMKVRTAHTKSLTSALRDNSTMPKETAMAIYVNRVRALPLYGCEVFPGEIEEGKKGRRAVKIAVGPQGMQILDSTPQAFSHTSLVSSVVLQDRLRLSFSRAGGSLVDISLTSPHSSEIHDLLQTYLSILLPARQKRNTLLARRPDPLQSIEPCVSVPLSLQINHPNPKRCAFGLSLKEPDAVNLATIDLVMDPSEKYTLLARINGEYRWMLPDDTIGSLGITKDDALYLIPEKPSVLVEAESGAVTSIELTLSKNIGDLTSTVSEKFKSGNPIGFTFYEGQRPLDFRVCVPFQTPDYLDVRFARRFYLFNRAMFDDMVTMMQIFRDVRNAVLTGRIKAPEDASLTLAVYALYAETENQGDVLAKVAETSESDLRALVPSSLQVSHLLIRKFRATCSATKPCNQRDACLNYLLTAHGLDGFGTEKYQAKYTNPQDRTKKANRDAIVVLTPYHLLVEDPTNSKILATVDWLSIVAHTIDSTVISVKYQDNTGRFCEVLLDSADDAREIDSFIGGILDIIGRDSMAECMTLLMDPRSLFAGADQNTEGTGFDELSAFEGDLMHNYDDLAAVDTSNFDREFDQGFDGGIQFGESRGYGERSTSMTGEDEEASTGNDSWRVSGEALVLTRSSRLLGNLEGDLTLASSSLDTADADQLYRQLSLIGDAVHEFAGETNDDDIKVSLLRIASSIDSARETAQNVAGSDGNISAVATQIQKLIGEGLAAVRPARDKFDRRMADLKARLEEEGETEVSKISRALIKLSDTLEDLSQIVRKDSRTLATSCQRASAALTGLAGSPDSGAIGVHLKPQITAIRNMMKEFPENIDLIPLETSLAAVERYAITAVEARPRGTQVYLGDSRAADMLIAVLEKSLPQVTTKRLDEAMALLKKRADALRTDPSNEGYRGDTLTAAAQALDAFATEGIDVSEAYRIAASLSTVAITPTAVQRVARGLERIGISSPLIQIAADLQKNAASGDALFKAQEALLKTLDTLDSLAEGRDPAELVLIERVSRDIRRALMEPTPSEDLARCQHAIAVRTLHAELGRLLAHVHQTLASSRVQNSPEIADRLERSAHAIQDAYLSVGDARSELFVKPFDPVAVDQATMAAKNAEEVIIDCQAAAKRLPDMAQTLALEQLCQATLTAANNAVSSLASARLDEFRPPPAVSMIQGLMDPLESFSAVLEYMMATSEVLSNPSYKSAVEEAISIVRGLNEALLQQMTFPNSEFYSVCDEYADKLSSILSSLMSVPSFAQRGPSDVESMISSLKMAAISPPPSIFAAKDCTITALARVKNLRGDVEKIGLTAWLPVLDDTISTLEEQSRGEFTLKNAEICRDALLRMQAQCSIIPPSLRRTLKREELEGFAKAIGQTAEAANACVTCTRLLAGRGNPKLPNFARLNDDDEIDDSIAIVARQFTQLQAYIDAQNIPGSPNSQALLKSVVDDMKLVGPIAGEPSRVAVLRAADALELVVNDENSVKNARMLAESIGTITRVMAAPHLDRQSATMFKQLFEEARVNVLSSLPEGNHLRELLLRDVDATRPKKAQVLCDEVHSSLTAILPKWLENSETAEAGLRLYDVTSKFTSLSLPPVRLSASLRVKEGFVPSSLSTIVDRPDAVPPGVHASAAYLMSLSEPPVFQSNSVLAAAEPEVEARISGMKDASIQSSVSAANSLLVARESVRLISSLKSSMDPASLKLLANTEELLRGTDATLLAEVKSSAAAVLAYAPMRQAMAGLATLVETLRDNPSARSLIGPLNDASHSLIQSIEEADICLQALFLALSDEIVTCAEELGGVTDFVRSAVSLLRDKGRMIERDPVLLMNMSTLMLAFMRDEAASLVSAGGEYAIQLQTALDEMSQLRPIMNRWANPATSASFVVGRAALLLQEAKPAPLMADLNLALASESLASLRPYLTTETIRQLFDQARALVPTVTETVEADDGGAMLILGGTEYEKDAKALLKIAEDLEARAKTASTDKVETTSDDFVSISGDNTTYSAAVMALTRLSLLQETELPDASRASLAQVTEDSVALSTASIAKQLGEGKGRVSVETAPLQQRIIKLAIQCADYVPSIKEQERQPNKLMDSLLYIEQRLHANCPGLSRLTRSPEASVPLPPDRILSTQQILADLLTMCPAAIDAFQRTMDPSSSLTLLRGIRATMMAVNEGLQGEDAELYVQSVLSEARSLSSYPANPADGQIAAQLIEKISYAIESAAADLPKVTFTQSVSRGYIIDSAALVQRSSLPGHLPREAPAINEGVEADASLAALLARRLIVAPFKHRNVTEPGDINALLAQESMSDSELAEAINADETLAASLHLAGSQKLGHDYLSLPECLSLAISLKEAAVRANVAKTLLSLIPEGIEFDSIPFTLDEVNSMQRHVFDSSVTTPRMCALRRDLAACVIDSDVPIYVRQQTVAAPSEKEALESLARATRKSLSVLPTITAMPIGDVKMMLAAEASRAATLARPLLSYMDAEFPQAAQAIVDSLPQLIPPAIRVRAADGVELVNTAAGVLESSLGKDQADRAKSRVSAAALFATLRMAEAAVAPESLPPPLEAAAGLAESLRKADAGQGSAYLADLDAIKDSEICEEVLKLAPRHQIKAILAGEGSPTDFAAINQAASKIAAIVARETPDLVEIVAHISSLEQSRSHLEKAISSPFMRIKDVSLAQAAALRGFAMSAPGQLPAVLAALSAAASPTLISLSGVSQKEKSRAFRSLRRILASLLDLLEEDEPLDSAPLAEYRRKFLQEVAIPCSVALSTLAARDAALVPESFNISAKSAIPEITSGIQGIRESSATLISKNTDPAAGADFSSAVDAIINSLNAAVSSLETAGNLPTSSHAQTLQALSKALPQALSAAQLLTDAVRLTPDVKLAEQLPKSLSLPSRASPLTPEPSEIQELVDKSVSLLSLDDINNQTLVDRLCSLAPTLESLAAKLLGASAAAASIQLQVSLSGCVATLKTGFEALSTAARERLLLRGNWKANSPHLIETLSAAITSSVALIIEASDAAQRDAESLARLNAAVKPLEGSAAIATAAGEGSGVSKDWAKAAGGIVEALCTLFPRVILSVKGTERFEKMLSLAPQICEKASLAAGKVDAAGKGTSEEAEKLIVAAMSDIEEASGLIDTKGMDDAVSEAVKGLAVGAQKLRKTAENAVQTRKERMSQASRAKPSVPVVTRTTHLKRLELESRVISARTRLERAEKLLAEMH